MNNADLAALVIKAEPKLEALYPDTVNSGKGRRATIRSMAITQVAKQMGLTESAVRQALRRASKSKPAQKPLGQGEYRFDFLGVQVSDQFRAMLSDIITNVKTASQRLGTAKKALTTIAAKYGLPAPYLKAWLEDFDSLANRTRALQPVGVCPWCKNTKTYRDNCPACYGSGWLIRAKAHAVPERLKQPNVVIQNGDEKRTPKEQAPDLVTEELDPWEM